MIKQTLALAALLSAGAAQAYEASVSGETRFTLNSADAGTKRTFAADVTADVEFNDVLGFEITLDQDVSAGRDGLFFITEDRGLTYASLTIDIGIGVFKIGRPEDLHSEYLVFAPFVNDAVSIGLLGSSEFGFALPILYSMAFSDTWADQNDSVGATFSGKMNGFIYGVGIIEERSGGKDTYQQALIGYETGPYQALLGYENAKEDDETVWTAAVFADWGMWKAEAMYREIDFAGFLTERINHVTVAVDPIEQVTVGLQRTESSEEDDSFTSVTIEYRPFEGVFIGVGRDLTFVEDDPLTSLTVGYRFTY